MGKIDLYRNVHKGQRARLFVLTVDIGRLDYTQPATVAGCMMRLRAMIDELREHGVHEERFIHPLLHAHAPAVAEMLEADHASFDQRLAELEALAARLEAGVEPLEVGSELYRTLCSTLSGYLAHLDYEETVAMPALWRACTPDALGSVILDFNASRGDAERLHDLRAQIGALTPQERAGFLAAITRGDVRAIDTILATVTDVLSTADLARLRAELGRCTS